MKSKLVFSALLLVISCSEAFPQTKPEPFLKRLVGTWRGEGESFGLDARLQLKIEDVLGNKFVRLSVKNDMRTPNGQTQSFEGHAYYQLNKEGTYVATWFDSRGISFPIKGQVDGNALIAFWGTPEQEQGKSVYRLLESGKLEVTDAVLQKDGSWKEFGRFVVTREQ